MMNSLHFIWNEKGSLLERLSQSFSRFSVEFDKVRRPVAIYLHHQHGIVTQICSKMHDLAPRLEVGVLEFATVNDHHQNELDVDVLNTFGTVTSIQKLVIIEEGIHAESGIVFNNARQEELIFVASAAPYVLAVNVPWKVSELRFDPAYALEEYRRVDMT